MELFNKEGHLTDEGLRAVVDGTLDEMGRLEASEHLSFCDSCLVRCWRGCGAGPCGCFSTGIPV